MKKSTLKSIIALAAFAGITGVTTQTHAGPPPVDNGWTVTGLSPGGGFIIDGAGTTDVGPLATYTTPVRLSSTGGDIITLNAGSTASTNEEFLIELSTPNNTLINNGSMFGNTQTGVYVTGNNNTMFNFGSVYASDYAFDIESNGNKLVNYGILTSSYLTVYVNHAFNVVTNYGTISTDDDYAYYEEGSFNTLNNFGNMFSEYSTLFLEGTNGTVNNYGTISTNEDYGINVDGSQYTINNHGNILSADEGIYNDGSNTVINNRGLIFGESEGIYSDGSNLTINNYKGGAITSSEDPGVYIEDNGQSTLNNWGMISAGDEGLEIYHSGNNVFNNWGTITSGENDGVYIEQSSHNTINNYGYILGNNGDGVELYESSNNTINNWGVISGANNAISLESSSHNTINLDGHSSVLGNMSIGGNHNTVNLNFTGLSVANIVYLSAVLTPQGVNSNTLADATFTVRGVTYNIDPAVINFNPSSYQLQGKNPTQQAIGAGLDSLTANPAPGTPLFNLLNAIDASGNVPGALQALSPAKYALYGDLAIENSTGIVQGIDRRLNNLRDGSESVDVASMGGDNNTVALTSGYSKDGDSSKDGKQIATPAPQQNRWGFFASGDGLFYRGGSRGGLSDGKANSVGTIAGVDGKIGEKGLIGAFFAYNNSAAQLDGFGSKATIESYSGGVYGSWHDQGLYANGLGAYTRNNYTSSNNTVLPGFAGTGIGSTHGNQATANIDGGYDFHMNDRFTLGPIAGLQYVNVGVNGFNESGGGLLALGSQNVNSLQSRVGAKAAYKIATSAHSSFGAEVYAAWQHEYLDGSRGISASFEGGGFSAPFSVQSGAPNRDAGVVGASLNFTFHDRLTLFTDYELQMWSSSNFEQTVNGGARISF